MDLIKPYGKGETACLAVVAKKNELDDKLFFVKKEHIRICKTCLYGPREFHATALTGAIDFGSADNPSADNPRHILVEHYNKVYWVTEKDVTIIDNIRKRKEPNRDLEVSDTMTKYRTELTMHIEKNPSLEYRNYGKPSF